MVRLGSLWFGLVKLGPVWSGFVSFRFGSVWSGSVGFGSVRLRFLALLGSVFGLVSLFSSLV